MKEIHNCLPTYIKQVFPLIIYRDREGEIMFKVGGDDDRPGYTFGISYCPFCGADLAAGAAN